MSKIENPVSKHLEAAMAVGNIAWWEMDLPSGEVRFNKNKTDMIGYDSKDFKHYSDFTKLVHPEDYESMMQAMRDHMAGKKDTYECRYRIQAKDGSWKWFYDRGQIVDYREDKSLTAIGVVINITAEMEAIESLEAEKLQLVKFNDLMVGRELRIAELKAEIAKLKQHGNT